ncbi:hypothetical protein Tco_0737557 [Tanacetum coccineum]
MTTPRPIPFLATTPRAGVFTPFVIISDSNDEITTLPVRPAPPSSDRTPTLYGHPLDSFDDSLDKDLRDPYAIPTSFFPSSSSPPSSLLPFSSRKRSRSPLPPPLPSPAVLPPPPEVVIPEATTMVILSILHRIVEACRWAFAKDSIDTWRHQEGKPRYEIGESSLA